MSGLEDRLLLEAVKPASGFISAYIAPKIEKLRLWSEERDLYGKIDPDALSSVMERYLIKLSERVSEVTSISFPQHKLNIFDAYEPLALRHLNHRHEKAQEKIDVEKIASSDRSTFIIVDDAGMGKSTFSKFIVAKLLFKSLRIPILFELRKLNPELDLIDNLALELDFPGKKFDRALFYKLLELGKLYVILDGFDEIQIEHQEKVANQIYELSVKGGDNNLLLTSRPQDALPELVNSISLKFIPFTVEQASSLLKRYDSISNLDIGSRLVKEIESVPKRFIESPLLVSLLYRTFGVNNSIADRISTFYDEIYHALYKGHDLINKNSYGREKKSGLDFEDFRKLLRALCHYMMLSRTTSFQSWSEAIAFVDKSVAISYIKPSSSSNFLDDLLVAVPLMQKDGNEYKFLHKTMLEFFAAEYLVFDKSSYTLVKKIFYSKLAPSFRKVFEFVADLNSSLFDSVITFHFADIARSNKDHNDTLSTAMETLLFLRKSKIGLWRTSEHSIVLDGHSEPIFSPNHRDQDGYNFTTWLHGIVGGEEYMLAITCCDIPDNLHALAWIAISDRFDPDDSLNPDACFDLNEFQGALADNAWVDFNEEILTTFPPHSPAILSLIINAIPGDELYFEPGTRLLCQRRIREIIDRVNREIEFESEMEKFL